MLENIASVSGNIADVSSRRIYKGIIHIKEGRINQIEEREDVEDQYILPGFVDAHIHIESTLLVPSEFARVATRHGTVSVVLDPHEIANVLGMEGIQYMIDDAAKTDFHFHFGAPPCVPISSFETTGGEISRDDIKELFKSGRAQLLSEVMNYTAAIENEPDVSKKLEIARDYHVPIDGHAPELHGQALISYISKGISTDHECTTMEEALEKINAGMKIIIRQGSAAKNFDALMPLIKKHPDKIMLCVDEISPIDLSNGHINLLIKQALKAEYEFFDVIRAATYNPIIHYGLKNGMLRPGDSADLVVINNVKDFDILKTIIQGKIAAAEGEPLIEYQPPEIINFFDTSYINVEQIQLPVRTMNIKVITIEENQIETGCEIIQARVIDNKVISDPVRDILKLVVVCRYDDSPPAVGFVRGFKIKTGAIATSISHDSHNIIATGVDDISIKRAVNLIIKEKGGIAYVYDEESMILPLPIAGLMSNKDIHKVIEKYKALLEMVKTYMECKLESPFMTLSFLSLVVMPRLKLSHKGLFDVCRAEFTDLFVDA